MWSVCVHECVVCVCVVCVHVYEVCFYVWCMCMHGVCVYMVCVSMWCMCVYVVCACSMCVCGVFVCLCMVCVHVLEVDVGYPFLSLFTLFFETESLTDSLGCLFSELQGPTCLCLPNIGIIALVFTP